MVMGYPYGSDECEIILNMGSLQHLENCTVVALERAMFCTPFLCMLSFMWLKYILLLPCSKAVHLLLSFSDGVPNASPM